jgi:preprotein translocase subunit SecB
MANPPRPAGSNGVQLGATPGSGAEERVQIRVLTQFIKDMSFENPSIGKPVIAPGENPNLQVDVAVNAQKVPNATNVFESAITVKALCVAKAGTVYDLECEYGALFELPNMPEQALEPFLTINAPSLIFPFLRRLVADITREGGFPPLLLEPIDFAGLYMQRRQQAEAGNPPIGAA